MLQNPKAIWDIPTRITHWALALCVILNLFFVEEGDDLHKWLGYAGIAFVAIRFGWGFKGSPKIRAKDRHMLITSVYATIWGLVILLGVTGYMMGMDEYWGEPWLEDLHGNISKALQVFILIHLLGVFIDSAKYKRRTWLGMVTGRR